MKDITTVYSITTWLLLKQLFDLSCEACAEKSSENVANQSGQVKLKFERCYTAG